jgi:CRP-like cAMP-binding protein
LRRNVVLKHGAIAGISPSLCWIDAYDPRYYRGDHSMPALATRNHQAASNRFSPLLLAGATSAAAEDVAAFDRIGTMVVLRRDQTLFVEGDPAQHCFKVVSGAVRSCKLADGRRQVNQFLLPGDFVGLEGDGAYRATVEAVNDATLMRYRRCAIDHLIQQQPWLGKRLLGKLCDDLYAAQAQMLLLGRKNAVERLASFLLSMSERNGEGDRLELLMTRGDIADHLGLTIETVSRTFSQLKERGIIQLMASSDVVIRRRDELEEIAEVASSRDAVFVAGASANQREGSLWP